MCLDGGGVQDPLIDHLIDNPQLVSDAIECARIELILKTVTALHAKLVEALLERLHTDLLTLPQRGERPGRWCVGPP